MVAHLTNGVLTTEAPRNIQLVTNLQPPVLSYLPTTATVFPKLSRHGVFTGQALDNGLEDGDPSRSLKAERQIQTGYSYLKPLLIDQLPLKDQTIKSIGDKQRWSESQTSGATALRLGESWRSGNETRLWQEVGYRAHVPRRSAGYSVVEEVGEYVADDSDGLGHRGKATSPHRNSQDITAAIKALDRFLTGVLNDDSYNSVLHPPPNPVLALVLSRYGRYVPGSRNSRVYAHMAVNNIHNNKPFGSYKLECDELPVTR